jgi:predicted oxidoreductase
MNKSIRIKNSELEVSPIAYGCMKLGGSWDDSPISDSDLIQAADIINNSIGCGINFFDHADIYTRGKSERVFGEVLKSDPGLRDKINIQSKCGIRFEGDPFASDPQRYDFSYEHIAGSAEKSLERLGIDYLDVLLLHRPDPLINPEEVARAFDYLSNSGMVKYFGVSNHNAQQIDFLQKYLNHKLIINQVELSLVHHYIISEGIFFNHNGSTNLNTLGTLDYCRSNDILIQAYSPLAKGSLFVRDQSNFKEVFDTISKLADEKSSTPEGIMVSWILSHPAHIQAIIGTTNISRITACCKGADVELTREEWYRLLIAMLGSPLP